MSANKPTKYEDVADKVEIILNKCKMRFTMTCDASISWEDMAQSIRAHINKKLQEGLYDSSRPFEPWATVLGLNQIKNFVKSKYTNLLPPCRSLKCQAYKVDETCQIYGECSSKCPLMKNWEQNRSYAYNIKLTLPIETHSLEVHEKPEESFNLLSGLSELNGLLQTKLSRAEYLIYQGTYIEDMDDEEIHQQLKLLTPNIYYNLADVRKKIVIIAKELIYNDLDFNQ